VHESPCPAHHLPLVIGPLSLRGGHSDWFLPTVTLRARQHLFCLRSTSTTTNAPPSLCTAYLTAGTMWRRVYFLLILVRIYFALSPSYLHPDENFQGPEVIAGAYAICALRAAGHD
jgi:hypothetical protein